MTQSRRMTVVREIMKPATASVDLNETLDVAADRMQEQNVDALAVIEDNKLVGVITVKDLHARARGEGPALNALVRDVVSLAVNFCLEHHTLEQAAAIMAGGGVQRLPVVATDHTVVGIVSLNDMSARAKREPVNA